jgi:lauroyl/myristoyl acyltransferase
MVMRFPTQYLWGYNRYKRPPGAASPEQADAAAAADPTADR